MKLTAEQLTAFLETRKQKIAEIVAPEALDVALAAICAWVTEQLPRVKDEESLNSLVYVKAVDVALEKYYRRFRGDDPDSEAFAALLRWRDGFVEAEIARTVRIYLFRRDEASTVEAETVLALWELRESFDSSKGPYVAWARGIARNKARSYRPFDKRMVSIDTDSDHPADLPSQGLSPEDSTVAGDPAAGPQGPPPQAFVELLRMLSKAEPHKAVAFIFNRYLRIKPAEIVSGIREMSLPEALAEATRLLKERYPEIRGIETIFAPLAGRVAGCEGKFVEYVNGRESIANQIGGWGETIRNSLGDKTVQKGKQFLKLVCGLAAAVHEIVCYLWIRLLFSPPVALRNEADQSLMHLVLDFEGRYACRELLAPGQVQEATGPLRKRAPEDRTLNFFAGLDLYKSIERWCEHIDSLIAPAAEGEHLLGYAYIVGSLRSGKEKIR